MQIKETKDTIKDLVLNSVLSCFKISLDSQNILVERPQNSSFGDFSCNISLQLSKKIKKSPVDIAQNLVKTINSSINVESGIKVATALGGFINFFLKESYYLKVLNEVLEKKENFGRGGFGKNKTWLIEHTSPNPNKAMHLGHLRNNVTGMALANIWEFLGFNVVRDCIDNNRGIAIAKLMWGYLKFARKSSKTPVNLSYWVLHKDEWKRPIDEKKRPDRFVDELYVKGSFDFKTEKDVEEKVRELVVLWENKNKEVWELWHTVLDFSYKGQQLTLTRLNNKWDKVWHEHEHYQMGKDIVAEGLNKGIFKKLEDGAILTNLADYGLSDTIVQKADGTSLYITQDLALTKLKRETFNPERLFWVIGPEQSLALKQLFAVCEQLGIGKISDYTHISYGYMSIKGQGKMSSRDGTVVYIDALLNTASKEIKNRIVGSSVGKSVILRPFTKGDDKARKEIDTKIEDISEKLGVGAVKYSILKVGRNTDMAFDFSSSLSFEGDSAPYIVYSYVRAQAIIKKLKNYKIKRLNDHQNLKLEKKELDLIKWVERFEETVKEAGLTYSPNLLCLYLFELANKFNTFYHRYSVVKEMDVNKKELRIALTQAVSYVIKTGLNILGIETVEEM